MAVSINLDGVLDKAMRARSWTRRSPRWLEFPIRTPPHLASAFNIETVRDLGSNKYFAAAGVLANHTS